MQQPSADNLLAKRHWSMNLLSRRGAPLPAPNVATMQHAAWVAAIEVDMMKRNRLRARQQLTAYGDD
ncbi:MAG: hypothetical protein ABGZ35_21865 [Planctomycetaceae bacterium]